MIDGGYKITSKQFTWPKPSKQITVTVTDHFVPYRILVTATLLI